MRLEGLNYREYCELTFVLGKEYEFLTYYYYMSLFIPPLFIFIAQECLGICHRLEMTKFGNVMKGQGRVITC